MLCTNSSSIFLIASIVSTSASIFGSESFSFSIPSDVTVPVVDGIATFNNITIYEGTFLTSNFTVSSANPAPPSRYTLDNANIDTSIFGTGRFFKEQEEEKKENIYSNIDDMLNSSLKPEEE